jgi:hypothetical protein
MDCGWWQAPIQSQNLEDNRHKPLLLLQVFLLRMVRFYCTGYGKPTLVPPSMECRVHGGYMIPWVPVPPPELTAEVNPSIYPKRKIWDQGADHPKTIPEATIRFLSYPSLLPTMFLALSRTGSFGQNTNAVETCFSRSNTPWMLIF